MLERIAIRVSPVKVGSDFMYGKRTRIQCRYQCVGGATCVAFLKGSLVL